MKMEKRQSLDVTPFRIVPTAVRGEPPPKISARTVVIGLNY